MNEQDIQNQLNEQQKALTSIYKSVEKTRKMIFWSGVVTAITFIIPLIVVAFMLPKMISTLTGSMDSFGDNDVINQSVKIESLTETLNNLKDLGF